MGCTSSTNEAVDNTLPTENVKNVNNNNKRSSIISKLLPSSISDNTSNNVNNNNKNGSTQVSNETKIQQKEEKILFPQKHYGFMIKQGHMLKNWKKRFFILNDGRLIYYDSCDYDKNGIGEKGIISYYSTY